MEAAGLLGIRYHAGRGTNTLSRAEGSSIDVYKRQTQVFVRKVAPFGDPVEVNVRGYELSLRKADAEMIEVQ